MTPLVVASRRSSTVSPVMMSASSGGIDAAASSTAFTSGGSGLGLFRWGKLRVAGWVGLVDAVADPRSVEAADQQRVEDVHDVVVERPAAAGGVGAAGEHSTLDLQEAVVGERLGRVDDEEVRQQQLGQRMVALLVRRPVDPAVEPVEEGQVGVQPGAVRPT